jgi:AAT family amino acid transporter
MPYDLRIFKGDIMNEFIVKRSFKSPVTTGMAAFAICFIASLVYWPVWGTVSRHVILWFNAPGLQSVDAKTAGKFVQVFAEATFFWMIINAWIWQTLVFGGYGKYAVTKRQPGAGIWYTLVGLAVGLAGFMIVTGFTGLWWKPFSLSVLFTPQNAQEVHMAIEGWEASNFYALAVILANIGYVALFHKWPFAGNIKAPWDGVGAMSLSSYFCLLAWFAVILPGLLNISIGGHQAVTKPMGSWPTFVAYAQCFIWSFLIPAEGGENYPMKLFAKKQPWMGLMGLVISLVMGYGMLRLLQAVIHPLNLLPGLPADVPVASIALSIVIATLLWHHVFDDYPSQELVKNQAARIFIRVGIWISLGLTLGFVWLKTFRSLPFGGTDLGYGFPVMGILAGQFVFLMCFLYYNTFFDKWPLVRRIPVRVVSPVFAAEDKVGEGEQVVTSAG